ncbi:MAG: putative Ig domain-containing protein, partial [Sphingobacteriales bacterium]|nr:putative Ig domain-containing protein [Sphingobacteriales bacterium]
ISGVPLFSGVYELRLTATNAYGTGEGTLELEVDLPPVIKPEVLSDTNTGVVGISFSYGITASNTPTSYTATGLPAGLDINSSTGIISGTPIVSGTFTVTVTATNRGGTGEGVLTLLILAVDSSRSTTENILWPNPVTANKCNIEVSGWDSGYSFDKTMFLSFPKLSTISLAAI